MSANAAAIEQPKAFAFTPGNLAKAKAIIARYPEGRAQSALIPLLQLAQAQHNNWLPRAAMDYVADMLETPRIRAYEVATFYTMFNRQPVGENYIQLCTTTPCWLRGSDALKHVCREKLGIGHGQTTPDGKFSMIEVECLGACVNAPMVQINDDYYEDLDAAAMEKLINDLAAGKKPAPGSLTGRRGSCAQAGSTSLKNKKA
ncbi:MAG: NADH-quinone oxidoreductase subunit NuoE [Alphaproteobacteria bacterium]